jgi:hypothetical protein
MGHLCIVSGTNSIENPLIDTATVHYRHGVNNLGIYNYWYRHGVNKPLIDTATVQDSTLLVP